MYHEFVYLSDAKVGQFLPADQGWWRGLRTKRIGAGLKVPPVEVSLEAEPSVLAADERRLRKLIQHLEMSARYYSEPDLTPGEWVMFDGRIGIAHLDQVLDNGAVLFCQAEPIEDKRPRVVLHGSARHVRPGAPAIRAPEALRDGGFSLPTGAAQILATVGAAHRTNQGVLRRLVDRSVAADNDLNDNLEAYFRRVACTEGFRDSAPYLGGHARVTAVLRPSGLPFTVVLASPLYVRYERP